MNREEAIYFANCLKNNYTVDLNDMKAFCDMAIKALAQEPTTKNDCEHCSKTYGTLGCCDFVSNEPVYSCKEGHEEYARGIRKLGSTTKNNLGVEEVTALAEWTEKLTKASEDAYNKGYADGMKAQEPRKGHWINTANPRMSDNIVCSECGYDSIADFKFCPCCGADMREVEE